MFRHNRLCRDKNKSVLNEPFYVVARFMSALPPKATSNATDGMSAGQKRTSRQLFDHLVGAREQCSQVSTPAMETV
jgi:hypothetical protein